MVVPLVPVATANMLGTAKPVERILHLELPQMSVLSTGCCLFRVKHADRIMVSQSALYNGNSAVPSGCYCGKITALPPSVALHVNYPTGADGLAECCTTIIVKELVFVVMAYRSS